MVDDNALIAQKTEHIKDYMRGYARADAAGLKSIIAFDIAGAWADAARTALARRHARFLDLLDDETLGLVAEGHIQMRAIAAQVVAELEGGAAQ